MNKQKIIIAFIGLITWVLPAVSVAKTTSYYFRTLEGLSQSTVNVIFQDSRGFMWFGTKDGLNMYDGLVFRLFQKENSLLGNNFITALYEDGEGNLWVGTDTGVYVYDPRREAFTAFDATDDAGTQIRRSVTCIRGDGEGNVWIAADYQGLFCYNRRTRRLTNELGRVGQGTANVTGFWFDGRSMWVGRYEDNLYLSADGGDFRAFTDDGGNSPFRGTVIEAWAKGLHNHWYIATSKGLIDVNLTTRKVRTLIEGYVRDVCFRSDTELWVGTEQGIYIYNLDADTFVHLKVSDGDDRYALSDNAIYSLFKDRENGVWIGSYFGGVNYYPNPYTYFEKYYPRNNLRYMGRRVREFCDGGDGTLWIGTEDKGLFHFNPADRSLTPFRGKLSVDNVHGLCRDGNYLWVGTFAGGLNRIDLRTRAVKHYAKGDAPNTLNADNVFSVCKTSTGELLVGTTSGLLRYNRATDDFYRVAELDNVFVYHIFEATDGKLWLATYSDGVFCYDPSQKSWKQYRHNPADDASLPYNKVVGIFEDSRRRLWFLTQGEGFCRFLPDTGGFVRHNRSNGFPANTVYKMLEDKNGLLWITTNRGLVVFHPETGVKHVYTTANGLLSNQFNYRSGYKSADGTFYLGSIEGFISFKPDTFRENDSISPLVLTDFSLSNKRQPVGGEGSPLTQSITFSDHIELKASQNSFSLRAAVLSYQSPASNTILYTLEGFDREWYRATSPDARIAYSNLPYGSYTLRVRGANSDGVWNPRERVLHIRVLPPFYLSWGAYVAYFLLLVAGGVFAVRYFRNRNRRKHLQAMEILRYEKERELYTAKIEFFTNVAHEIRTPLTLIKSPLENVLASGYVNDNIREDLMIMDLNTNRLLDLVNQLLDFRKTETKGFRLNFVECNLSELLRKAYVRFTPLMRERKLDFTAEADEGIRAAVDVEGFTKIISNLLNNAVKYAATYIHVRLTAAGEQIVLSVENDGNIIPPEMREEVFKPFIQYRNDGSTQVTGTGIGLSLARSLAELHEGTLSLDADTACNRFVLRLPLYREPTLNLAAPDDGADGVEAPAEETAEKTAAEASRYTLLVVEDNAEMRRFLVRRLSRSYKVFEAGNGKEALRVLQQSIVNLIVSDVMMPEMNGLELCDTVKSELEYSHIPVVLLTAKTNLQAKIEGLKTGADAYVEKPFSPEYLDVCISNLLKNREQLQATFVQAPFAATNSVAMTKADEDFLKRLNEVMQENIQNPDFSLTDMADQLCMSRSSLNRKIKGVLDITPNDYIRIERLKKAACLLREGNCKVNEVCYMVGFNTPSYFTKCFQKQFGVLPKDFVAQLPR